MDKGGREMKRYSIRKIWRRFSNGLIHVIVNNDVPLNVCKQLDELIHNVERGEVEMMTKSAMLNYSRLSRILIADGLAIFTQSSGLILTPQAAKFRGYQAEFWLKFVKNLWRAFWSVLVAIIIPLAVAYFTVKFTIESQRQPQPTKQPQEELNL
jgi:hypothetical protein